MPIHRRRRFEITFFLPQHGILLCHKMSNYWGTSCGNAYGRRHVHSSEVWTSFGGPTLSRYSPAWSASGQKYIEPLGVHPGWKYSVIHELISDNNWWQHCTEATAIHVLGKQIAKQSSTNREVHWSEYSSAICHQPRQIQQKIFWTPSHPSRTVAVGNGSPQSSFKDSKLAILDTQLLSW